MDDFEEWDEEEQRKFLKEIISDFKSLFDNYDEYSTDGIVMFGIDFAQGFSVYSTNPRRSKNGIVHDINVNGFKG